MLFSGIESYREKVESNLNNIPESRERLLDRLSTYIKENSDSQLNLVFICTHNSRRSHFGQVWGKVWADYFGLDFVETYSGGTEATAFNPRAVEALRTVGFSISNEKTDSPKYELRYSNDRKPILAWSKTFDDEVNPQSQFAAVMTCSDADEACPFIPGAEIRIPLVYEDPKKWDDTDRERQAYKERCLQIATEMYHVMKAVSGV